MLTTSFTSTERFLDGNRSAVMASFKRQVFTPVHKKGKLFYLLPIRPFSRVKDLFVNMHSNATIWKTLFTVLWVPTIRIYLQGNKKKVNSTS